MHLPTALRYPKPSLYFKPLCSRPLFRLPFEVAAATLVDFLRLEEPASPLVRSRLLFGFRPLFFVGAHPNPSAMADAMEVEGAPADAAPTPAEPTVSRPRLAALSIYLSRERAPSGLLLDRPRHSLGLAPPVSIIPGSFETQAPWGFKPSIFRQASARCSAPLARGRSCR